MQPSMYCARWSWNDRLLIAVVACLGLWRFLSAEAIVGARVRVSILRAVVPRTSSASETTYLAGVLRALGLKAPVSLPALDRAWLRAAEPDATGAGSGRHLRAAYALLTAPPQLDTADWQLAEARVGGTDERLVALWAGRAAWARENRALAAHSWEIAFGDRYEYRKRLAEALYLVGEIPLAIDEAVELLYLLDSDDSRRVEPVDLIRNWIFWQGESEEEVVAFCDRVLQPTWQGWHEHVSDPRIADILARRAMAEFSLGRREDALRSLADAELLGTSAYVRAVRAYEIFRSGFRNAARTAALDAAAEAGADGHALLLDGHILWELGEEADAIRVWSWVVERVPLLAGTAQGRLDLAYAQRRERF